MVETHMFVVKRNALKISYRLHDLSVNREHTEDRDMKKPILHSNFPQKRGKFRKDNYLELHENHDPVEANAVEAEGEGNLQQNY